MQSITRVSPSPNRFPVSSPLLEIVLSCVLANISMFIMCTSWASELEPLYWKIVIGSSIGPIDLFFQFGPKLLRRPFSPFHVLQFSSHLPWMSPHVTAVETSLLSPERIHAMDCHLYNTLNPPSSFLSLPSPTSHTISEFGRRNLHR